MNFSEKLTALRRQAGMSQEQLADQVGVRRETIMRLEKAQYNPSLKLAVEMNEEAICNFLKWPRIDSVASILYAYAWNSYEIASKEPKLFDVLRPKWNNAFRLCQSLVRFRYDYHFEEFLQAREDKFLQ